MGLCSFCSLHPPSKRGALFLKKLPDILLAAFTKTMDDVSVDSNLRANCRKWLRFYLDLCFKYRRPPQDPES
jgi:hypothetical protein